MAYDSTTSYLQGVATTALTNANNNAGRIWGLQNVGAYTRDPIVSATVTKPNLGEPPKFSDLFTGEDSTNPTIQYLNSQADDWIAKYFPAINGNLKNIPEDWLVGVISGVKPFGMDKSIFEIVWHNARDRAYRTMASEQRTLEANFSARGFSLPPGALVDALTQSSQRGSEAILEVNREQAIKDAEIKLELLKFAVEQATRLKTGILGALADFYRMWLVVPDKDIERARIRAQANSALYSALSSYYNVEVSFEELKLRAEQLKAGIDIDVDRNALAKQHNYMSIAGPLSSAVNAFAGTAGQAAQAGGSLSAEVKSL